MTDDRFEEFLKVHGEGYNRPPSTPADEMWTAIQGSLDQDAGKSGEVLSLASARAGRLRPASAWSRSWVAWSAAAAAVLALGVGIGRLSIGPGAPVAVAISTEAHAESMRSVAMDYLTRTESLLTMVRSDARTGTVDTEVGQWGRGLLLQTRMLMDSPAADDPVINGLLQDLELILMQVAGLDSADQSRARGREELDMITQGLEDQNMMLRLRAAIPAGGVQSGI